MSTNPDRLLHGAADIAHALEAAIVDAVDLPAVHAARVELAVGGAEPAAVDARAEVADKRHDGSLRLAGHLIAEHEEVGAGAKRKVHELAAERSPAVARYIRLPAAGVVEPAWQIHHRQGRGDAPEIQHRVHGRLARLLLHLADRRGVGVVALRDGHGDRAVGQEREAVGIAEARGHDVDRLAVGADPQQALMRGGEEVAGRVALQAALVVVATRGLEAVGHAGVEVGLAVAVGVVEPAELVAAKHIHDVIGHDEAQGLVQAGGHPSPADVLELRIEAGDPPHVALDRADRGVAVREEVVPPEKHQAAPRVVDRQRDRVDGIRRA